MFARTHRVFSHVPFGRLKNPKRPARRHAEGGRLTYCGRTSTNLGQFASTKPYQNHGGSRPYLRITSKKFRRDLYPCSLQARNLTKITGVRGRTFSQTHNIAVATSLRESLVICGWSVIPVKKSRSQEFILIISTKNNILTFVL